MIIGTGVDIVEIPRLKKAVIKWKDKFLKRVFTDNEIAYSKEKPHSYQHLAARFAAKEAVLKAFGNGWNKRVEWTDVEIWNEESGKPVVKVYGNVKKMKDKMGVVDIAVSLSHARTYAVASAILVGRSRLSLGKLGTPRRGTPSGAEGPAANSK
ncbi:MAG: holo-ACP synthase [Candidatus Omnitrophota bacterium]